MPLNQLKPPGGQVKLVEDGWGKLHYGRRGDPRLTRRSQTGWWE